MEEQIKDTHRVEELVSGDPTFEAHGIRTKLAAIRSNPQLRMEFIRYLVVGASSAIVEFSIFALSDRALNLPIAISNSFAMACSMTFNFILSRFWTFAPEKISVKETARSLIYYLALFVLNSTVTSFGIKLLIQHGHISSLLAKLIMMGAVVAWNFVIYHFIIFKRK